MSKELKVKEGIVCESKAEGQVRVTVLSGTDCEDCDGTCGTSSNTFEVTASDPLGVGKGDRVKVEIKPRSFAKVASIVFGVPAVALLGGLGLGSWLSNFLFGGNYKNAVQGGTAGLLFLISLGGLILYDRYLAARSSNRAEVTELLKDSQDCPTSSHQA